MAEVIDACGCVSCVGQTILWVGVLVVGMSGTAQSLYAVYGISQVLGIAW